jgi:hypothetical protein
MFFLSDILFTSCYFTCTCLVLEISLFGSIVVFNIVVSFYNWHSDPYLDYAADFTGLVQSFKLRRINPNVLLPLPIVLSMCLSHVRLLEMVTPRYLLAAHHESIRKVPWRTRSNFRILNRS